MLHAWHEVTVGVEGERHTRMTKALAEGDDRPQPIREALNFIPADDRELWLRIGMAIKSELGETGFGLWDAWSQQAACYNSRDARDVWKSIRADGPITVGTLFHEAKMRGWRDVSRDERSTNDRVADRPRLTNEGGMQDSAERERERADTARKANEIWRVATEAKPGHPYLARKQVLPVCTLREIEAGSSCNDTRLSTKVTWRSLGWSLTGSSGQNRRHALNC